MTDTKSRVQLPSERIQSLSYELGDSTKVGAIIAYLDEQATVHPIAGGQAPVRHSKEEAATFADWSCENCGGAGWHPSPDPNHAGWCWCHWCATKNREAKRVTHPPAEPLTTMPRDYDHGLAERRADIERWALCRHDILASGCADPDCKPPAEPWKRTADAAMARNARLAAKLSEAQAELTRIKADNERLARDGLSFYEKSLEAERTIAAREHNCGLAPRSAPVEPETTRGQLQAGLDAVAGVLGRPGLMVGEHADAVCSALNLNRELLDDWELFGATITGCTNHSGRVALEDAKSQNDTRIRVMHEMVAKADERVTEARAALTHEGLTAREWAERWHNSNDCHLAQLSRADAVLKELADEKAAHEATKRRLAVIETAARSFASCHWDGRLLRALVSTISALDRAEGETPATSERNGPR